MNKCEETVLLFPAIRAEITRKLINEYAMSQSKIAEILGITQAAVSQYMKSTRGKQLLKNPEIDLLINKMCREISDTGILLLG